MGEIGDESESIDIGGNDEMSSNSSENEVVSSGVSSIETVAATPSIESVVGSNVENIAAPSNEIVIGTNEISHGSNQNMQSPEITIGPLTIEQAQSVVESYHNQSISQIIAINGNYMSEADRTRVLNGADSIRAVERGINSAVTGGYNFDFSKGKSSIEVAVINQEQLERTTKHETNHFASAHRETQVPDPNRDGYMVFQTVGTRQTSWFHSNLTEQDSGPETKGHGLNEALTTMYTNQQFAELDKDKAEAMAREDVYSHALELCIQFENIVGEDALKEAYYGGDIKGLEAKVDSLAGEKEFEALMKCFDRAISDDYAVRIDAMKEAQDILDKMYEEGGKEK